MKFPKLRNALTCRLLMYAPIPITVLLCVLFGCLHVLWGDLVSVLLCVACILGLLVFMIRNYVLLMGTDLLLALIVAWSRARSYYTCPKNGSDRQTVKRRVLRRLRLFGRARTPIDVSLKPIAFRHSKHRSQTVYWSWIARTVLVYETDILDEQTYRDLLASATANAATLLKADKKTKKRKATAPVSLSTVVVILADSVAESVAAAAVKTRGAYEDHVRIDCVVDCGSGRYYFDGLKDPFIGFGYPTKNRAINMVRKYVFGGRSPLRKNDAYLPYEGREDPDTSLWEFVEKLRLELRPFSRADRCFVETLREEEAVLRDSYVYCKLRGRAVRFYVEADTKDPRSLTVFLTHSWSYPKENRISKLDFLKLEDMTRKTLTAGGYTVTCEDDEFETEGTRYQ